MQCTAHDPLYDVDPETGATIEVFFADRALETFGRCGQVGSGALASVALRQTGSLLARSLRATQHIATP